ncbi:E3 ubiquitin-protein ligase synoviolin [Nematocida homosporus]|uniref:E3 ubiquitin-protein ligase synoviolin n=1 Tax=Nematocida homosporus TaxID=1912981 RepID=UPI00221E4E2F|nr:E3 ubiquitin-protein ligase synoviolin [Nematocida homosporus]KAI5184808.1 E3 ubiquitin-protein ligase synoviolin [Nematocida homosporus]
MYRHAIYLGGYLVLLIAACISHHRSGKTLYHVLTEIVENRVEHFIFCSLLVYLVYIMGRVMVKTFIGKLTPLEVEGVQESSLKYLGNICLVITLFADDIGLRGLLVFSVVFGLKVVHWAVGLRIDSVDKGVVRRDSIWRLYGISAILFLVDGLLMSKTLRMAIQSPGVNILFAFEFSLLFAYIIKCIYSLGIISLAEGGTIEDRILLMFYGELFYGVFRIVVHVLCFIWTTVNFRMPINLLRESMLIVKSLTAKVKSTLAYTALLKELEKYPNVPKSEITDDGLCLICHDEMEVAKRLECSHLFHLACLKEWLHRQQSCPVCRTEIKPKPTTTPSNNTTTTPNNSTTTPNTATASTTTTTSSRAESILASYFQPESDDFEGVAVSLQD